MTYNNKKLGAFIVPTGIGATIGGYAGDASPYARRLAKKHNIIVNPNVVNAGCFSGITSNMFYVEGYSFDSFLKGEINLVPSYENKIGIVYDKSIPEDVLNIHINTQNAVKSVYGIDILEYEITKSAVGVNFYLTDNGISVGGVENISTLENSCEILLNKGCDALALVCYFKEPENLNIDYSKGIGVDPVGGVEAIISHDISKKFRVPCAHSPAFFDSQINSEIVHPKSAAEYITPTFLPCILLGLNSAPKITTDLTKGINIKNLDYIVMPYNCLGATPVYECLKQNIQIYAVKENSTTLNITKNKLFPNNSNIIEINSYDDLFELFDIP